MIGRAQHFGDLLQFVGGAERAAAGEDRDLLAGVQDFSRSSQIARPAADGRCAHRRRRCDAARCAASVLALYLISCKSTGNVIWATPR